VKRVTAKVSKITLTEKEKEKIESNKRIIDYKKSSTPSISRHVEKDKDKEKIKESTSLKSKPSIVPNVAIKLNKKPQTPRLLNESLHKETLKEKISKFSNEQK